MKLFYKLCRHSYMRLFLVFIAIFIIPLVLLSAFFIHSYQLLYSEERHQAFRSEINSIAIRVSAQINACDSFSSLLCRNDTITECIRSCKYIENDDMDAVKAQMKSTINRASGLKPTLFNVQVILLSGAGDVILGKEYLPSSFHPDDILRSVEKALPSTHNGTWWFTDASSRGISHNKSYVYSAKAILNTSDWTPLGYLVLRIRSSDFASTYLVETGSNRSIFILDDHEGLVSSADNLSKWEQLSPSDIRRFSLSNDLIVSGKCAVYSVFLPNQWKLVAIDDEAQMPVGLTRSITLYVITLFICIGVTVCISFLMSKHFMRPIDQLIHCMYEAENGNLHSRASIKTNDEFELLAESYNKMIEKIETLMDQVIHEQEQKRRSDIRMLQMQINPHFLYNALASIRYLGYNNQTEDVDTALLCLTRFLKYALSGTNVYSSIGMELEQLDQYIALQQFSFETPLRYEAYVEPGLEQCRIVKLLLQPLVENAILHGLKKKPDDPWLRITIKTAEIDRRIRIEICDNGIGFDPHTLDIPESENATKHHLGLLNVRQRLSLHYDNDSSFEIRSAPGAGTSILISIPKQFEGDPAYENPDC